MRKVIVRCEKLKVILLREQDFYSIFFNLIFLIYEYFVLFIFLLKYRFFTYKIIFYLFFLIKH